MQIRCFQGVFYWVTVVCCGLMLSACDKPERLEEKLQVLVTEAENGNAQAQFNVARRYESGSGFKRDEAKALYWYTLSGENKHTAAQLKLGQIYAAGNMGVPEQQETAADWFLRAAMQGNLDAQVEMSRRYHTGMGRPIDQKKSLAWLRHAARRGQPASRLSLAEHYLNGALLHRNDSLGVTAIVHAAQLGQESRQTLLGFMYAVGLGVPKDKDKARTWLAHGQSVGNTTAEFWLGMLEMEPQHPWKDEPILSGVRFPIRGLYGSRGEIPGDFESTNDWLESLAQAGNNNAHYDLARLLFCQENPDTDAAIFWLKRAARDGHSQSQRALDVIETPLSDPSGG